MSKYDRSYYLKNKEKLNAAAKEYYKKNKENILQYQRKYHAENKDNPEYSTRKREVQKRSYLKNRDKSLEWQKKYWLKYRIETLRFLGGEKCKRCSFGDWRALCVDHVGGNGNADRRGNKISNVKKFLEHIKKNPLNYQVLCANCNQIKKHENKEFAKRKT